MVRGQKSGVQEQQTGLPDTPTPARLEGCSLRVETPETRIANTQQKENIVQYGAFFIKKHRLGREKSYPPQNL
jgi:hypothetical protein